jgi:hypothetical protein
MPPISPSTKSEPVLYNDNIPFKIISKSSPDRYRVPTKSCCYWCCHPFDTVPVGLPMQFSPRGNKFVLSGMYCSYGCVLADNKEKGDMRLSIRSSWVRMLAKYWHGIPMSARMHTAPSRRSLKMFGGPLDIADFRKFDTFNDKTILVQEPPILHVIPDEVSILSRLKESHKHVPSIVAQKTTKAASTPATDKSSKKKEQQHSSSYVVKPPRSNKSTKKSLELLGIRIN